MPNDDIEIVFDFDAKNNKARAKKSNGEIFASKSYIKNIFPDTLFSSNSIYDIIEVWGNKWKK